MIPSAWRMLPSLALLGFLMKESGGQEGSWQTMSLAGWCCCLVTPVRPVASGGWQPRPPTPHIFLRALRGTDRAALVFEPLALTFSLTAGLRDLESLALLRKEQCWVAPGCW